MTREDDVQLSTAEQRTLITLLVRVVRADRWIDDAEVSRLEALVADFAPEAVSNQELVRWCSEGPPELEGVVLPARLRPWFLERARKIVAADGHIEPIELHAMNRLAHEHFEQGETAPCREADPTA